MEWTFVNLITQTLAGLVGSIIASAVAHEHRFGFWGHSLVGLVSGGIGGLVLQKYASTMVTASGSLNEPTHVQIFASQALTGAVLGAISMMAIGFVIKSAPKAIEPIGTMPWLRRHLRENALTLSTAEMQIWKLQACKMTPFRDD